LSELFEYHTDWRATPPRTEGVAWFVREVGWCASCGAQERFRSDTYWRGGLCEHITGELERTTTVELLPPQQLELDWNNGAQAT